MDITWLNNQRGLIFDKSNEHLYDEVVKCCELDMLRPAYILAWILIVESLRGKIEKLATLGDNRAILELQQIEKKELAKSSNDKVIYDGALNCEIVESRYSAELDYFWQQRCLYAHPYHKAPTELDVQHIVTKAFEMVLKSDVYYHKDRINEIVTEEVANFHIVPQVVTDQIDHIRHHLLLIREEHYPFLYKTLFFELSKAMDVRNANVYRYLALFIRLLVEEKNFDLNRADSGLQNQISAYADKLWGMMWLSPSIWTKIAPIHQDQLFNYVELQSYDIRQLRCVNELLVSGIALSPHYLDVYYTGLDKKPLEDIWPLYYDQEKLVNRIEATWIKSTDFRHQARFIEWLKDNQDNFDTLFNDDIKLKLGIILGKCCRNNTFVALEYIKNLPRNMKSNAPFVRGMAGGIFLYNEALFIPTNCTMRIIELIHGLPIENQDCIVGDISQLTISHHSFDVDYKDAIIRKLEDYKEQMSSETYQKWLDILNAYYEIDGFAEHMSVGDII